MKPSSFMAALVACGLVAGTPLAFASSDSVVTAVFSSVSNGYQRQKLPDGSVKPEYYAIAQGRYIPGKDKNASIDDMPFSTVAQLVGKHLATENYYFAQDAKSADILLLITWGTTVPFNDIHYKRNENNFVESLNDLRLASGSGNGPGFLSSGKAGSGSATKDALQQAASDRFEQQLVLIKIANDERFKANEGNARILGYVDEVNSFSSPARWSGAGSYYNDLNADLEEDRYYVIIAAYDFRTAVHGGQQKILWTTRVSISARHNRFDDQLESMLAAASRQFGKQSDHLIRRYREERIKFGELKFMGVVPNSAEPSESKEEK